MKIAIAGYGAEGKSNYTYFTSQGHELTIADERTSVDDLPEGVPTILGEDAFSKLNGFELVIRTAGLNPNKIVTDGKIWSATNEFFAKCPATIIGVTGSKGKGTTCSLIASILRAAEKTVHLVGNIGLPALDELSSVQVDDIVVYELSSFQLWDIEKSPHIAVVLGIEPDHLDVHENFTDYVAAKANIARFQTSDDVIVFNADNTDSQSISELSQANKIAYPTKATAHVSDGWFYYNEHKLCSVEELKIPGVHNQNNACAAISVAAQWTQDGSVIAKGLASFEGLPHRLKFTRDVNGVSFYDDSIATTPGSAIAALKSFTAPKVVILGGSSKGADFGELAQVASEQNIKLAITIGEEADKLTTALGEVGVLTKNLGSNVSMNNIVYAATEATVSGDVVILSPACASFGMYKNYADRGDQFIAAVNALE
ncbi:MAG: UDP-N-acetylmuramoyl-L-alanine--D-glutamate ligase [Candidatus Saccharibacteria bacterium]